MRTPGIILFSACRIASTSVLLMLATSESSAAPIEGDRALLQLLRDAQATNSAAFPQGRLRAGVKSANASETFDANAELIWRGEKTWWEFDLTMSKPGETAPLEKQRGVRMIETPRELLWYNTRVGLLQRIPDRLRGYHDILRLRPDQIWFCYQGHVDRPWSWFFDPDSNPDILESLSVEQLGDEITVIRKHTTGTTLRIVSSLAVGGNVIRYESTPYADAPPGVQSTGAAGELHWLPLSEGRFRLKSYTFREYQSDPEDPVYSYSLDIEEFEPDLAVDDGRFTMEALRLEPGTRIEDIGPQGAVRTTVFGKIMPEETSDKELDELAEQLRERGFASPQRSSN